MTQTFGLLDFNRGSDPNDDTGDTMRTVGDKLNHNFQQVALQLRSKLAADTTFFVHENGSNSNNGLSAVSAFATLQYALDHIYRFVDLTSFKATVRLLTSISEKVTIVGLPYGAGLEGYPIAIAGSSSNAGAITWSFTPSAENSAAIQLLLGASVKLENIRFASTNLASTSKHSFLVAKHSSKLFIGNLSLGRMSLSGSQINLSDSSAFLTSDIRVTGGAECFLDASKGSYFLVRADAAAELPLSIVLSNTPAYQRFLNMRDASIFSNPNGWLSFSGPATGSAFNIDLASTINFPTNLPQGLTVGTGFTANIHSDIVSTASLLLGEQLTVAGETILENLSVGSSATVEEDLTVEGLARFDGGVQASDIVATAVTASSLTVSGGASLGSLLVQEAVALESNLSVAGDLAIGGEITVAGGLTSAADITAANANFTGNLVAGAQEVNGALTVRGATNLKGPATLEQTLTVAGIATFSAPLTVNSSLDVAASFKVGTFANIGGPLTVQGNLTSSGNTSFTGLQNSFTNSVSMLAALNLNGQLTAGAGAVFSKEVNVGENLTVGGTAAISRSLSVGTSFSVAGSGAFGTDLSIGADVSAGGGLSIGGSAGVSNNLSVGGSLTANGQASCLQGLVIEGLTSSSGGFSFAGNGVTGGSLTVAGALRTSSTFQVNGTANFSQNVAISQNLTARNLTLTDGSANITGGLNVSSDANLAASLSVGGVFSANQQATFASGVNVSGALTAAGVLTAESNLIVNGTLIINQNVTFADYTAQNGTIQEDLTVLGTSTLTGAVSLNNSLSVAGASNFTTARFTGVANFDERVNFAGAVSLNSTVAILGNTTFANNATIAGRLAAASDVEFSRNLTVGERLNVNQAAIVAGDLTCNSLLNANRLNIANNSTMGGQLEVSGNFYSRSTALFAQNVALERDLSVLGSGSFRGDLTSAAGLQASTNLSVGSNSSVGGNSAVGGSLTVNQNATVAGTLNTTNLVIEQDLEVEGNITVAQELLVGGAVESASNLKARDLTITADASINGDLLVKRDVQVDRDITVASLLQTQSLQVNGALSLPPGSVEKTFLDTRNLDQPLDVLAVDGEGRFEWSSRLTTAEANIITKAPLISPAFDGVPLTPTPNINDTSNQVSNTTWVREVVNDYLQQAFADVADTIDRFYPPGMISIWSGDIGTIPVGWILCDGANGTPDFRDKFVMGAGSHTDGGDNCVGATGGVAEGILTGQSLITSSVEVQSGNLKALGHALTIAEIPNHDHELLDPGHVHKLWAWNGTGDEGSTDGFSSTRNEGSAVAGEDKRPSQNAYIDTNVQGKPLVEVSQTGVTIAPSGESQTHGHNIVGNTAPHTHTVDLAAISFNNLPPYYAAAFVMRTGTII